MPVEEAFSYVLLAVVAVSVVAAVVSLRGDRYDHIGRGGLFEEEPGRTEQVPAAVRDEEVRQMLDARNARRVARGQEPVDVEAELARLIRPASSADPALAAEIRALVVARNERRARRGEAPLDVEAEVRRQLDDLMG